ncbi:MAG TPA: S9 family peptidase, partial [Erythrobacter sp.]|nr:S9 family peptidase [Erythrobacter sp.]
MGAGSHKLWGAALLLAGVAMPLAAQEAAKADDLTIAARQFGSREDVLDISLSPSGNKIAFVSAGPGHSEILSVIDLAGEAVTKRILANSEMIADLDWC